MNQSYLFVSLYKGNQKPNCIRPCFGSFHSVFLIPYLEFYYVFPSCHSTRNFYFFSITSFVFVFFCRLHPARFILFLILIYSFTKSKSCISFSFYLHFFQSSIVLNLFISRREMKYVDICQRIFKSKFVVCSVACVCKWACVDAALLPSFSVR